MEKSSTGLEANIAGLLCYVVGWVSGLVFILIERQSNFVRFHAIQSIYTSGILTIVAIVLSWIFGWMPIIGPIIVVVLYLLILVLWLILCVILMIRAYQGEKFKLPLVGNWTEKTANSLK